MLIDFTSLPETVTPNMRGGEKEVRANMFVDPNCKIMLGKLIPGASIGMHAHETSSEIIYVLSGRGQMLCDDVSESLTPGACHYCPLGHAHSLANPFDEDLTFLAIVPEHKGGN